MEEDVEFLLRGKGGMNRYAASIMAPDISTVFAEGST